MASVNVDGFITRSPAVARMADCTAPVVKLGLTLTLILPGPREWDGVLAYATSQPGVNGLAAGGGPAYQAQSGDLVKEKQIWYLKLGAILHTTQSSLSLPTHHTYIQTHPRPSGLRNGPTYVALALWLNVPPCKWSGVKWSGDSQGNSPFNYVYFGDFHLTYVATHRVGGGGREGSCPSPKFGRNIFPASIV